MCCRLAEGFVLVVVALAGSRRRQVYGFGENSPAVRVPLCLPSTGVPVFVSGGYSFRLFASSPSRYSQRMQYVDHAGR